MRGTTRGDRRVIRMVNRRRARQSQLTYAEIADELEMGTGAYLYNWLCRRAVEIDGAWIEKELVAARLSKTAGGNANGG